MEKELPKNWVTAELNQIFSYVIGGDWGKDILFDNDDYVEALCIRGSEIKNWNRDKGSTASLRKIKKSSLNSRKLEFGDILLEISGGGPEQPVGRTVIVDDEALNYEKETDKVCTNFLRLVRVDKKLNSFYVNHYLQYFYHLGEIVKYQGGSNNLRNLKYKEYETISIPLPPLSEQNRIVEKLDRLFGQLEVIKTSMEKIPVLLKNFRQQVLTQAVTGKLTEEWIEGKELENWRETKLSIIADIIDPHPSHRTPSEVHNGIPYIGIGDIDKNGDIDFTNARKVSENILNEHLNRYTLRDGDFIFGKIGTIGRPIIIPSIQNYTLSANVILIKPRLDVVNSKFLFYYLDSPVLLQLIKADTKSTSQPAYGIKKMREQIVPLPSTKEQQEIVSRVESLFAKADAIEEKYKNLKAKIETLPQTILHKAFKGELSEQLETDGDARDLLEEILALKNGKKPKKNVAKKYVKPDEILRIVAEESLSYPTLSTRDKKVQRKMLATHIINQSLEDKSFGKTKFEKLLHLIECHVLQRDLNQNYSVQAAGPYDGGFTKTFWDEVLKSKWFAFEQQGTLKRIVSGENQNKSVKEYGYFSNEEKQKINDFIAIFENTNYERPEIVSTLYAVWNNRIKRNEAITDHLLKEDFLNWDPGKAKYKDRLDKALEWMRENGIVPNGWGNEIKRSKRK